MNEQIPHITRAEFLQKAVGNKDINFIAFVVTPWHAISLDASILYLQAKGVKPKGMVLISPHVNSGVNVNEDSFLELNYELYIEETEVKQSNASCVTKKQSKWERFIERRSNHSALYRYVFFGGINWRRKPILYIINQNNPETMMGLRMQKYRHAKFVLNDEGIGSYGNYFHMEAPVGDKWKGFRVWMNYFREEVLSRQWICTFHHAMYTTILNPGKYPLEPRKEVIPYYEQVLVEHAVQSKKIFNVDLSRSVLIAPSVYIEETDLYHGEDERIWKEICEELHKKGYKLYMKPHPRDNYFAAKAKEWHCEVIDRKGFSMEELCAISKPMCVIGCPSTALVTASLFYNVPSICIVEAMEQNAISEEAKDITCEYINMFGNLVQSPKSHEHLIQMVQMCENLRYTI